MSRIKDILRSFTLAELLKGMRLTGRRFVSRKFTVQYPEEKTPQSPRFRGLHALRESPRWRGAVYRLQAMRSGVPGPGDHD